MSAKYEEQSSRPCPFVPLHEDNEFASIVALYVEGDGWRRALGVELVRRLMERDETEGLKQTNRVSAAMNAPEYRAAIDWLHSEEARKRKQKERQRGSGSSQPSTN